MNKPIRVVISPPMVSAAMFVPEIKASSVPAISLTQNYPDLQNLPKINGVTLVGDKSAAALSLLSSKASDYPTMRREAAKDTHYVPILGEVNGKIRLSDIAGPKLSTVSEIPLDMAVGDYIFLEKE